MSSSLPENEAHEAHEAHDGPDEAHDEAHDGPFERLEDGLETPGRAAKMPPEEASLVEDPPPSLHSLALEPVPLEPLPLKPLRMDPVLASDAPQYAPPYAERPLFQSWNEPQAHPVVRIPHFGHLCLLVLLALIGLLGAAAVLHVALHFHLYGISTMQRAMGEIHYTLGTEALLYLFTFVLALLVFPLFWHKSLMAGLQWNGVTALRLRKRLAAAAFVCFLIALLNSAVMPGPANTPIEKIFRMPGAAWLLFVFGVTFAPFFEEMFFRGFLLPALCTAYDWFAERTGGEARRPLDENGHPQWSLSSMVIASIATSLPFAWMHGAQTGYSVGPLLLLVGVSLVLCGVRLWTRSLAASVMVHACYNFLLFALMILGTDGFRHLNKM